MSARGARAPAQLGAAGAAYWSDVVASFDLLPAELRLLEVAAEARDEVAILRAVCIAEGFTVDTEQGGQKPHPAAVGLDRARAAFLRAHTALKLPGDVDPAELEARRFTDRSQLSRRQRKELDRGSA